MRDETKTRIRIVVVLLILIVIYGVYFSTVRTMIRWHHIWLGALVFGLQMGMMLWVYYDGKKRGIENVDEWMAAIVVPAIGLFGLLAYLHYRKSISNGK